MYKCCSTCQERTSSSRIIPLDICALWCQISYGRTITERLSRCWSRCSRGWELIGYCKGRTCRFATIFHCFDFISTRLGDPIDSTIGSHCSTHWSSPFGHLEGNSGSIAAAVSYLGRAYRTTARWLILVNWGLGWCWFYSEFHLLSSLTTIGTLYCKYIGKGLSSGELSTIVMEVWFLYIYGR